MRTLHGHICGKAWIHTYPHIYVQRYFVFIICVLRNRYIAVKRSIAALEIHPWPRRLLPSSRKNSSPNLLAHHNLPSGNNIQYLWHTIHSSFKDQHRVMAGKTQCMPLVPRDPRPGAKRQEDIRTSLAYIYQDIRTSRDPNSALID